MRTLLVGMSLTVLLAAFAYATIQKTAQIVDLYSKSVLGKTFTDGLHVIGQRRDGAKISIQFRNNAATQIIYSSPIGQQTSFDVLALQSKILQGGVVYSSSACTVTAHNETPGKDCAMTTPVKTWKWTGSNGVSHEITLCISEDCDYYEKLANDLGSW